MSKEDSANREYLIGVADVLLEPLSEQLENEHDAIIIDSEGDERGTLRVELWPVNTDGKHGIPDEEVLDDLLGSRMVFALKIPYATGIPPDMANSVRIEFIYFNEEPQQVPAVIGVCTEPKFNYEKTFVQDPVTPEFLEYLQTQSLVFHVYGSNAVTEQMEPAPPPPPPPPLDRTAEVLSILPCQAPYVGCETTLFATACKHKGVCTVIEGVYHYDGQNFDKPVYKKEILGGGKSVIMYYWDSRDGDENWGWWIAELLGPEGEAYAFHSDKDSLAPPKQGWHIPFDKSIDSTFEITTTPPATNGHGKQQMQATQLDCATTLFATSCKCAETRSIIEGAYHLDGQNFGKPVYKKLGSGGVGWKDVIMYYWDSRDGDENWGWWIAEFLGPEGEAYAFHSDKDSHVPPKRGWHIPFDKSIDTTFNLAAAVEITNGGGERQMQADMPKEKVTQSNHIASTSRPAASLSGTFQQTPDAPRQADSFQRVPSGSFRPVSKKNSRSCIVS